MIRATNTITGVSLIRCKRKHYFVRKNKNLGQWLSDNECFLICTCPVSYPNMGILKMKKSWNGVPKNQVAIEVRLLDIYLCYSLWYLCLIWYFTAVQLHFLETRIIYHLLYRTLFSSYHLLWLRQNVIYYFMHIQNSLERYSSKYYYSTKII